MANKGGDARLKRQMAPAFWKIHRKQSRFVVKVKPGRHSKASAYSLGIALRDILKVSNTLHEAKKIIKSKKVKVDGKICTDINAAIRLMDVLEFVPTGQAYRFVPNNSEVLTPIAVPEEEKSLKIVKVLRKVTTKGNKTQYGYHDGNT